MTITFYYGLLNKNDSERQSIYIRVRHGKLYFKRTLNIPIERDLWNFKKNELVKGRHNCSETKQMYEHANFMLNAYENQFYNEWAEIKHQLSSKDFTFTQNEWKNWCSRVIKKVNSPVSLLSETPPLVQLWSEYIKLKSETGEHQKSTTKTWKARLTAYKLFEEEVKEYNTNELDMRFYAELRKYILRIRQPKDELAELRTLNYFGDFIKKIKASPSKVILI